MPSLRRDVILWTLEHITLHGDTDIFPYPLEFQFFNDCKEDIATKLAAENIATYKPMTPLDSLVPKSRSGFRVAHQLYPTDSIMLTAAVLSIGKQIEGARASIPGRPGFSYRYYPTEDFKLFSEHCRYGDWLRHQHVRAAFADGEFTHVVEADISDFYQRIYHHRLDNCLQDAAGDIAETRMIKFFLRDIRARQSFGIPVGGNASRLLAELALVDIDRALVTEGYSFTRYVDDFRIFIRPDQEPYSALAFLADSLWSGEGLSLASSKTRVVPFDQFQENLEIYSGEDAVQAEQAAAERLLAALYEAEDNEVALEDVGDMDLVGEMSQEVEKEFWDIGKIRILLRLMKLTKDTVCVDYIKKNYARLLPFSKELVLLMEELSAEKNVSFQDMEESVVDLILSPAVRHLHVTRAWLLELFTRGVIKIGPVQANRLNTLSHALDRRAILSIRSSLGDTQFFRHHKTRVSEMPPWLQPALIQAAQCLPSEEYKTWLGNVRQNFTFPLSDLFIDWARSKR